MSGTWGGDCLPPLLSLAIAAALHHPGSGRAAWSLLAAVRRPPGVHSSKQISGCVGGTLPKICGGVLELLIQLHRSPMVGTLLTLASGHDRLTRCIRA